MIFIVIKYNTLFCYVKKTVLGYTFLLVNFLAQYNLSIYIPKEDGSLIISNQFLDMWNGFTACLFANQWYVNSFC